MKKIQHVLREFLKKKIKTHFFISSKSKRPKVRKRSHPLWNNSIFKLYSVDNYFFEFLAEHVRKSKPLKITDAYKAALDHGAALFHDEHFYRIYGKDTSIPRIVVFELLSMILFITTIVMSVLYTKSQYNLKDCKHAISVINSTYT